MQRTHPGYCDCIHQVHGCKAKKYRARKHVISALNEVSEYFGVLKRIIIDRGTAFTSHKFERYCQANDVKDVQNAVRKPRVSGYAERSNHTILGILLPSTKEDKCRG